MEICVVNVLNSDQGSFFNLFFCVFFLMLSDFPAAFSNFQTHSKLNWQRGCTKISKQHSRLAWWRSIKVPFAVFPRSPPAGELLLLKDADLHLIPHQSSLLHSASSLNSQDKSQQDSSSNTKRHYLLPLAKLCRMNLIFRDKWRYLTVAPA